MRTGACTVQQALTTEAASVLKHSLNLAKRRGHAQVTPLHVAATLLSSSSRETTNLLRRACLKSHPHHPTSHPLQCRALELCFNVALNRLPTTPPPSSGPLIHTHPSLSNALIAALKRAQAHQRRGCIEQQQQQLQQQQQQQPLLAIKVELDQLIISILDDPSVSRVMREAGFSSTCVKNNLEEDSSISASSSSFFFETHREIINQSSFWQTHFLKSPVENPVLVSSQKEDLRVVLEVMLKKQSKRNNTVVVGDSVSSTEGLVVELMGRVERGEVPDELKSAHFIKFQFSSLHLRFMSRGDVDMKMSDLRRKITSLASERGGGGVIIYLGDLRWAVDEETRDGEVSGYDKRPVEHLIAEVGRLLSELRICNGNASGDVKNKVWLMATASYQTYMRCQMRQPSLETQWALQAVAVPSGGLALSLHAPSGLDSKVTKLTQNPFQMMEPKPFNHKEEQENLICCAECTSKFEKEASGFKSSLLSSTETKDGNGGSTNLPYWMQPHRPDSHHKDTLLELRRKWNRICQSLHHTRHNLHLYPTFFNQNLVGKNYANASSHPWWSTNLHYNQNNIFMESHSKPNGGNSKFTAQFQSRIGNLQERDAPKQWFQEVSLNSLAKPVDQDVRTNLALGSLPFSDSATSTGQRRGVMADPRELCRNLQENIPWQSEIIPSLVEALLDYRSSAKKGACLFIQGTDRIGKRRLALATAESVCGSIDRFININMRKLEDKASSCAKILTEALRTDPKCVVLIEEIDRADANFTKLLAEVLKNGKLEDPIGREVGLAQAIFILTTTTSTNSEDTNEKPENVMKLSLRVEETPIDLAASKDPKRKPEWELSQNKPKKPRTSIDDLDLNISAEDHNDYEEEDAVPSDLTHETDGGEIHTPHGLLESASARFTFDTSPEGSRRISESFLSKLNRSFDVAMCGGERGGCLYIDQTVVEELMEASGSFLDSLFERWLREVFQMSLQTVKKGGKVRLSIEGKEGNVLESGFLGSVLPNKIQVE